MPVRSMLALLAIVVGEAGADEDTLCVAPPEPLAVTAVAAGPPPETPSGIAVDVTRGIGPVPYGCGYYKTRDCDARGYVDVAVSLPAEAAGFAVSLVDGEVPDGLELPEHPIAGDRLTLSWDDGGVDEQEPVAFDVDIVAIDAAGRASAPVRVAVVDRGRDAGPAVPIANCAQVPPSLPFLVGLALLRRRRAGAPPASGRGARRR